MRLFLDTHTFAWTVGQPENLSPTALALLTDPTNPVFVSPVTLWEMSIKHKAGKWPEVAPFLDEKLYSQFLAPCRAGSL